MIKFKGLGKKSLIYKTATDLSKKNFSDLSACVLLFVSTTKSYINPNKNQFPDAILLPQNTANYEVKIFPELSEINSIINKKYQYIIWFVGDIPDDIINSRIAHELKHISQYEVHGDIVAKERLIDVTLSIYGYTNPQTLPTDEDAINFVRIMEGLPEKYSGNWKDKVLALYDNRKSEITWIKNEIDNTKSYPININIGNGRVYKMEKYIASYFNELYSIATL